MGLFDNKTKCTPGSGIYARPARRSLRTGPSTFADSPVLPPAHGVDGAGAAAAHARAGPRDAAEAEHPGGEEDSVRARGPLQASSRRRRHRAPLQLRPQDRRQVRDTNTCTKQQRWRWSVFWYRTSRCDVYSTQIKRVLRTLPLTS